MTKVVEYQDKSYQPIKTEITDAEGNTFDSKGNPIKKDYNGNTMSEATYDQMGNPVELADKMKNVCYTLATGTREGAIIVGIFIVIYIMKIYKKERYKML